MNNFMTKRRKPTGNNTLQSLNKNSNLDTSNRQIDHTDQKSFIRCIPHVISNGGSVWENGRLE